MREVNRFFGIYERELPPDVCQEIIRRFEADDRKVKGLVGDSKGGGGAVDPSVKSTTEILLWTHRQGWEDVNRIILRSLQRRLREYMRPFAEAFPIGIHPEEPRITRYQIGEGFNAWHSDNIGRSPTRVLTAIWYLNTVDEGGETEYKWQSEAIRPVEGRLLLCPVGWPFIHRGKPPISGPKYIMITQLHQASPQAVQAEHEPAQEMPRRPTAPRPAAHAAPAKSPVLPGLPQAQGAPGYALDGRRSGGTSS